MDKAGNDLPALSFSLVYFYFSELAGIDRHFCECWK
jgi:hypothetical protein